MTTAQGTINIAAPANVVWDWIVEPEKYLVWNTDFTEYRILDVTDEKTGTTFHMIGVKGGAPTGLDCVVTAYREEERYSFRGTSREGMEVEGTFTVEPKGRGCRVSFEEELTLPGVKGKIIEALFLKKAKMKNIEESLQKLKEAVEKNP